MHRLSITLPSHPLNKERIFSLRNRLITTLTIALVAPVFTVATPSAQADLVTAKPASSTTADSNACDQNATAVNGVIVKKIGNECVVQFSVNGSFSWIVPNGISKINRLLIVGGGGAGGSRAGAGGGAGGYVYKTDVNVTQGSTVSVTVGAGGGETSYTGGNGGDSSITISGTATVAKGGGGGGSGNSSRAGVAGASGGGSMGIISSWNSSLTGPGSGTTGQGYAGGTGYGPLASSQTSFESTHPKYTAGVYPQWLGGGGGGAGGVGGNASVVESGTSLDGSIFTAGKGGLGIANDITGTNVCYAAGGGGGGSQRATGSINTYVLNGAGSPPASWGNTGDVYIDQSLDFRKAYLKSASGWSLITTYPFANSGVPGGCVDTSTAATGGNGGIGLWKGGYAVPNSGSGGGGGGWLAANASVRGQPATSDWTANSGAGATGTVVIRYTIANTTAIPTATTGLAMLDLNPATYSGSGTTWSDASGSSNNATLVNAPTYTAAIGTTPAYFTLNGTNQAFTTITQYPSPGPQTFSIATWFKTDMLGSGKIIGFENNQPVIGGTSYDRHLYVGTDHKLYYGVCDTTMSPCLRTVHTLASVNDNQWHFAVATQSTVNGVATISLSLDNGAPYVSSVGGLAQIYSGYWKIGAYKLYTWTATSGDGYFKGSLGRISIYNTALNSAQATQLYNAGYSPTAITATPDTAASGKVNLSWPAATSATGYTVKVYNATGSSLVTSGPVISVSGTSATVTGLTPGTGYKFTVTPTGATGAFYSAESAKSSTVIAPSGACAYTRSVSGPYTILKFDTEGSCRFTMDTITSTAEYLVVGGGGGGGTNAGYGGQGGYYTAGSIDSTAISGKLLTLIVGSGGAGGQKIGDNNASSTLRNGLDGSESSLTLGTTSYAASGGAGGLTEWEHWGCYTTNYYYTKQGFAPLGTSVPGKKGLAGGAGGRAATGPGVAGGAGTQGYVDKAQVFNASAVFSSGGGGGGWAAAGASGGGNAGNGGGDSVAGTAGTWYGSGGGAGGSNCMAGGNGYKGVVYIRYLNPLPKAPAASLTLPVSGAYQQYMAQDFNALSKVWKDSSGNNRDATVAGGSPYVAINTAGTVNSRNDFYTVSGSTTDSISFGRMPTVSTVFHVARYNGSSKARIFNATAESPGSNWLSGFWNGLTGMAHHNQWNTQSTNSVTPQLDWLITTDQHAADDENLVRFNGVDRTTNPIGINPTGSWGINIPVWYGEYSDYSVAEVIVYDRALSLTEIAQVEDYLTKKYVYQAAQAVGYLGGGSWQPDQYCPAGKVAVGLTFNAIADVGMSQLKMRCGVIAPNGLSVDVSTASWATSSPVVTIGGSTSGEPKVANCPTNNVLTGLHMVQGAQPSSAWGQKWPVGVRLQCAPIDHLETRTVETGASKTYYPSTGYRVSYAYTSGITSAVMDSNDQVDSGCPVGQLAVGFYAKTGSITDNLGLLCGYPSLGQPSITSATATSNTLKSIGVTWGAVANTLKYGIAVYDSATGSTLLASYTVANTETSTTINTSNFSTISDGTGYKITVTAQGDGSTYANSLESAASTVTTLSAPAVPSFSAGTKPSLSTSPGVSTGKVRQGTSVTIVETATVSDGGTMSYQWQKQISGAWRNIAGATSQYDTFTSVGEGDAGVYRVLVSNTKYGVTSDAVVSDTFTLTVVGIVTPTTGLLGKTGSSYSLTLRTFGGSGTTALASGDLTGTGLSLNSSGVLSATSPNESTTAISVSFTSGGVTDTTTVFNVKFVGTRLDSSTAVTATPTSNTLKSIDVTWNAVTSANRYQLILRNDTGTILVTTGLDSITGTTATITSTNYADMTDNTKYKVSVIAMKSDQSIADSLESDSKTVTTNGPVRAADTVTISVQGGGSSTLIVGKSITLISSATGYAGSPNYQWQKNGVDILGATSDSYTVTSLTTADAGEYTLDVSYTRGGETSKETTSNSLTLSVVAGVNIVHPTSGLVGIVGKPYSLKLTTDAGTAPIVWSAASTLGGWMSLDTSTGTISGTPSSTGFTRVVMTAKDANNSYDTTTAFSISIVVSQLDSTTISASPTPNKLKSFDLSWTSVTNADRYQVTMWDETGTAVLATVSGITGTNYTFTSNDYLNMKDESIYNFTVVAEDSAGNYGDSADSNKVAARTNRAPVAPTFSVQPTSATKYLGESYTFTATASTSLGALSYQWRKDGADIVGANSNSYVISNVTTASAGTYMVVATSTLNGLTATTNSVDTATLTIGLKFETPTAGLTAAVNHDFRLPLQVTGGKGAYTFEETSGNLAGVFDLSATTGLISGSYESETSKTITVKVTDENSNTQSVTFTIKVVIPVFNKITTLTAKPTSGTRKSIDLAWNRAESTTADLIYIVTLYDAGGDNVLRTITTYETSTGTTYVLTDHDYADLADDTTYKFTVKVAGTSTIATSDESDKVSATTIGGPVVPTISLQPATITPLLGSSGTLSVKASASNNGPLTYQWYKGTSPITGAISDSYTVTTITNADAATYSVKITNTVNGSSLSIFSNSAQIIPATALSITTPTAGLNAPSGKPYRLMVESSGGTDPKTYAVTVGTLPKGLAIDTATGLISGSAETVTANTTFTIAVSVKDANGTTATTNEFKLGVYTPQLDTPTVTATASTSALKTFTLDWTAVANATSYSVFVYTSETGTTALNSNGLQELPMNVPFTVNSNNTNGLQDGTTYWVGVVANFDSTTAETQVATSPESVRKSVTTCTVAACTNTGGGGGTGGGGTGGGTGGGSSGGTTTTVPVNTTPTPQTGPTLNILPGQQFNSQVPVPGATNFVVQGGALPAGLTLNPTTGLLSGTVTQTGPYLFTILATPPTPGTLVTYQGNIVAPPPAPIVAPTLNLLPGAPFSYTPNVPGATNFALQSGSLPAGVTLNPTTGVLSGTPTTPGPYSFSIVATPPATGQVITFSGVVPSAPAGGTTVPVNALTDLGLKSLDPIKLAVSVKPQQSNNVFVVSSGNVATPSITPNKTSTGLVVSTTDVVVNVAGQTSTGAPLPLSADGQIVVSKGLQFSSHGSGYAPNSEVRVYMFSEPQLLGILKTDANGDWIGSFPIPTGVEIGDHVLQVNGYLKNNEVKSVSVGVAVVDPVKVDELTKVYEAVIGFYAKSAKVPASGAPKLSKLTLETGSVVKVFGYTKKSGTKNDLELSLDRALEVKKALLKLNPYIKVIVAGMGSKVNKKCVTYKNYCAVVTVQK